MKSGILILDFGSQFTQLIARRLREIGVYCEIYPCDAPLPKIEAFGAQGLILSGGPYSVYDKKAPKLDVRKGKSALHLGVPVLGICYGMQLLAKAYGGEVRQAKAREYGRAWIEPRAKTHLIPNFGGRRQVWMSHGDEIGELPERFQMTAISHNGSPAAMEDRTRGIYAVQFHPEVGHTEKGAEILKNFALNICAAKADWNLKDYLQGHMNEIRAKVGKSRVICALSGGVDSTVAATLVHRAVGDQLVCVFVDNGLLRQSEAKQVLQVYREHLKLKVRFVDASSIFLKKLKGVTDPEKKRKIIGKEFIEVFKRESRKIKGAKFLVQGTLYPDVIESVPPPRAVGGTSGKAGFSAKIKSHHNVGGLPKDLKFQLIEPLRELFKDEVRRLGRELAVPDLILKRHPFPGPGLAVRVMGALEPERLEILRAVDAIFLDEIRKYGLYDKIWQAFAVYLPVRSVGVMGDGRSFDSVIALRAVTSEDGMTADWYRFEPEFLSHVSNRITGEVKGVGRVVYDVSSKPPATIEWE